MNSHKWSIWQQFGSQLQCPGKSIPLRIEKPCLCPWWAALAVWLWIGYLSSLSYNCLTEKNPPLVFSIPLDGYPNFLVPHVMLDSVTSDSIHQQISCSALRIYSQSFMFHHFPHCLLCSSHHHLLPNYYNSHLTGLCFHSCLSMTYSYFSQSNPFKCESNHVIPPLRSSHVFLLLISNYFIQ